MTASTGPRRPPGGSQPRAERTRQAVIDETARYIVEEGFVPPSVRRITERAGLTWGVVQYHFGDLDGLLMAVVDQGFRELTELIEQLPGRIAGLAPARRTEVAIDTVWQAFSSQTSIAALEILIFTRVTRTRAVNSALATMQRRFTKLGEHLGADLDAPHAERIGNLIWAAVRGMVVAQMVSPGPLDTTRDRQTLVDVLTTYVEVSAAAGS
ncbi:TetR/AcrR family transcriptional regulator [Mycobacterium simiae]|uniref:TetR/AcrR family transcriptional regulator n=1 Tax=Mycobacterium simiae TaxID=1784 RepID=UPI00260ABBE1|nr:TetR/AcrR family transcriptional regulator [Mycobacterium simiae]